MPWVAAFQRGRSAAARRQPAAGDGAMLEGAGQWEPLVNVLFLAATGAIAWHAIRFRDEHGEPDFVRLLFGCIAAIFFLKVLLEDMLGAARF
jgi:hypothetical protein